MIFYFNKYLQTKVFKKARILQSFIRRWVSNVRRWILTYWRPWFYPSQRLWTFFCQVWRIVHFQDLSNCAPWGMRKGVSSIQPDLLLLASLSSLATASKAKKELENNNNRGYYWHIYGIRKLIDWMWVLWLPKCEWYVLVTNMIPFYNTRFSRRES